MCDNSVIKILQDDCTGCMMCGDICPKGAISFHMEKGFWFPNIDETKCVNCSLCYKRCPVSPAYKADTNNSVIACFGAKTKNEEIRYHSTSGGFFSELAISWINDGGYVCGALYDDNQEIKHEIVSSAVGVEKLRQSKYAQSLTTGIYKKVKVLLQEKQKVLFCGTPCQVAALKSLIGKKDENLLTLDFICLGICSPLVYRKYLQMIERKYESKVKSVWFKDKRKGWRSVGTSIIMENGKEYYRTSGFDYYMIAFIKDALSMRSSCHSCKFRNLHHISDFTIGDFWGIEKINKAIDDDMGLSALIVNTEKGIQWFNAIKGNLNFFETKVDDIVAGNFNLVRPKEAHPNRERFLSYIENHTLNDAIKKYSSISGSKYYSFHLAYYRYILRNIIKSYVNG